MDSYIDKMDPRVYQPLTIEELIAELFENEYLFKETAGYIGWADERLKKKK